MLGNLTKMVIAGRELREAVADADHRAAIEKMVRKALIAHPATVQEGISKIAVEPGLATQPSCLVRHILWPPSSMMRRLSCRLLMQMPQRSLVKDMLQHPARQG